jgi:flagellar transcriptional activator FlhD
MLAQQMLRADKASALYRLGIPESVAEIIDSLKPSQLLKIAQSNTLICQVRGSDDLVWRLFEDHATQSQVSNTKTAAQMHARVLVAGDPKSARR